MKKTFCFTLFVVLLCPVVAWAHFPWIYADADHHARMFFGEGLADQDYNLPDAVASAKVYVIEPAQPISPLEMKVEEEEDFYGMMSVNRVPKAGQVQTSLVYGNYHGTKLCYYVQGCLAGGPELSKQDNASDMQMQAVLTQKDGVPAVKVLWDGKPMAGVKIVLANEAGTDAGHVMTDDKGGAVLEPLAPGLNGFMVMHVDKKDKGEIGGKKYSSATHVLTVTFQNQEGGEKVSKGDASGQDASPPASLDGAETSGVFPAMPQPVASFGAAVSGGFLYVYSGHTGTAHDHSRDNLSPHFSRIQLNGGGQWEPLAMGPSMQGLAMVAYGNKLFRVGGLVAHNSLGEDEDLHSQQSFACYNPGTNSWDERTPLPGGRSSHNAVVIGNSLYVVGGWKLTGDRTGEWYDDCLAINLDDPEATWTKLPAPPFCRRALAVSHVAGQLVALCGMTDEADLSREVFFLDLDTGQWVSGPEFPGEPFDGFGLAAWNDGGMLYAGGNGGVLYRLSSDQRSWVAVGEFTIPRFFHQLLPDGEGALLAVGGASHQEGGHLASVERITPATGLATAGTAAPRKN